VTVPIEETIEGLQKVVEQGKARYLGFSEWTPEQIQAAIDIAGPDLFVSAITGASRPGQVHANAAASGIELSDDVLDAIDHALGDVPVKGQTLGALATEGVTHRE
jgi:aryl-alcohol dehydrogenase-like predicted oxidoreductase